MNTKKLIVSLLSLLVILVLGVAGFKIFDHFKYIKEAPYDVLISDIAENSVTISWKSPTDKPTYIKIGDKLFGDDKPTKIHRLQVSGLKSYSDYNFEVSDGRNDWDHTYGNNTKEISQFVLSSTYTFRTAKVTDNVNLPEDQEIDLDAYKLAYIVLKDSESGSYSTVRSIYTNRFGGAAIDKRDFFDSNMDSFLTTYPNAQLEYISYITDTKSSVHASNLSLLNKVFASSINCNQTRGNQTANVLSKSAFADLAKRWTAGRGQTYASECYNDVIYRAKVAGFDPAFALTIWLNESGASNYTQDGNKEGLIEDFGIHGISSAPAQDFNAQISYFLKLTFNYDCPGLSYWEAWGNMYRWGSCNTNDPVKRQQGIDYYLAINDVYKLVTNGKSLPDKINGYPKMDPTDDGGWDKEGPLCCALKLDNKDNLKGDFEDNSEGKTCSDVWQVGRSVYGGKVEYSVEIPDKTGSQCEVEYTGVCCVVDDSVLWYPQGLCQNVVANIGSASACKEYANTKACFVREGKYQWLPKSIGSDFLPGVTTESGCTARNDLSTYTIKLKKGINLVGFDFTPTYNISSMLASNIVSMDSDVLLVGKFTNGKWSNLVKKSSTLPFAGDDFALEQNEGYLIITDKDIELSLDGWKDTDLAFNTLSSGWNLVGGSIYTNYSNASSIISVLSDNGINVDTIAKWDTDLGHFNYRTESSDLQNYGEDFQVYSGEGLFLRDSVN